MISVPALDGNITFLKHTVLSLQKSPRAQVLLLIEQRKPASVNFGTVQRHIDFEAQRHIDLWSGRAIHEVQTLCDLGQLDRALDVLLSTDLVPSVAMYRCVLKACSKRKALDHAKRVQSHLVKHGLEVTSFLGESLVITLVKCGGFRDALQVFHRLPHRTVFSWTAVISGYSMSGQAQEALRTYQWMQEEGVEPNSYTLVSLLKACGSISDLEEGKRIHSEAVKYGCISDLVVATSVVDMYAKCRSIADAQDVFDGLSQRDVVSWNAMIAAYASSGQVGMALKLYEQMLGAGISPDVRTFVSMLQVCCASGTEEELVVDRQLSRLESLQKGYALQSQPEKALELYEQMLKEGVSPDTWTIVPLLQACGSLAEKGDVVDDHTKKFKSVEMGKEVHAKAFIKGFDLDVFIANSLISMYSLCGSIPDAQIVFNGLSQQNVVSWTAMLAAYVHQGQGDKALQLYQQMLEEGISPNNQTFVVALQACPMCIEQEEDFVNSQLIKVKAIGNGKAIHANAWSRGYKRNLFIGHSLISMYGKCGSIVDAEMVSDALPLRSVVAWNAMLAAYAQHGQAEKVLQLYNEMLKSGVSANDITFLCVLQVCSNAGSLETCREIHHQLVATGRMNLPLSSSLIHSYSSHAGLVDKGIEYFLSMGNDHHLAPDIEHYISMVDLLGRAGHFTNLVELLSNMPMQPNLSMWLCLLGACRKHNKLELGKAAFDCAISLQPENSAAYVLMSNIYAQVGLWECVKELNESRQAARAWSKPSHSWIQHDRFAHSFVVGDCQHTQQEQLYDLLGMVREVCNEEGHHL